MDKEFQSPTYRCANPEEVISEFGEQKVPHNFQQMSRQEAFIAKTKVFGDPRREDFHSVFITNCNLVGFGEDKSTTKSLEFNKRLKNIIESTFQQIKDAKIPYILHSDDGHTSTYMYRFRKRNSVKEVIKSLFEEKYREENKKRRELCQLEVEFDETSWFSKYAYEFKPIMNDWIFENGKKKMVRDLLSNHAFGTAIDINYQNNPFDWNVDFDMSKHLIAIMARNGFRWGGYYKDFMHFEYCLDKIIEGTDDSWISDKTPLDASTTCVLPINYGKGFLVNQKSLDHYYERTEKETKGGYYPIGANTLWHGGIHLYGKPNAVIKSCFDGTIIATRLAPQSASQYVGSRNFILTHHRVNSKSFYCLYMHLADMELKQDTLNQHNIKWTLPKPKIIYTVRRWQTVNCRSEANMWGGVELEKLKDGDQVTEISWEMDPHKRAWLKCEKTDGSIAFVYGKTVSKMMDKEIDAIILFTAIANNQVGVQSLPGKKCNKLSETLPPLAAGETVEKVGIEADDDGDLWYAVKRSGKTAYILKSAERKGWVSRSERPKDDNNMEFLNKLKEPKVVSLNIPIKQGEALWTMGKVGKASARYDGFHWEIFSSDNLLSEKDDTFAAEDNDSDYNMDNQNIFNEFSEYNKGNQKLTTREIKNFYKNSKNKTKLRNYACKFISEWGIPNVQAALDKIPAKIEKALSKKIEPYLWWQEAIDANVPIPKSPIVWHYNPITILKILGGVPEELPSIKYEKALGADEKEYGIREPGVTIVYTKGQYDDEGASQYTKNKYGEENHMPGKHITELQANLCKVGLMDIIKQADGIFGGDTEAAIRSFQAAANSNERSLIADTQSSGDYDVLEVIAVEITYTEEPNGYATEALLIELDLWIQSRYAIIDPRF